MGELRLGGTEFLIQGLISGWQRNWVPTQGV